MEHLSGTPKRYSYTDYGLAWSFPASLGPYTVRSRISRPDRMTVQTGQNLGTVLRSGLKSRDWTAYKSVRSGPVSLYETHDQELLVIVAAFK